MLVWLAAMTRSMVVLHIMAEIASSMPMQVHTDGRSAAQSHRKHMRVENRDLREEVSLPFCVSAGAVPCTAEALGKQN